HPITSPDINPIESTWLDLKTILSHSPHYSLNIEKLCTIILLASDELLIKSINRHIRIMQECVKATLAAKGDHTKF
ncbi:hypothetical protein BDQ12DRAFT_611580, partial [Crucibulum laeve]